MAEEQNSHDLQQNEEYLALLKSRYSKNMLNQHKGSDGTYRKKLKAELANALGYENGMKKDEKGNTIYFKEWLKGFRDKQKKLASFSDEERDAKEQIDDLIKKNPELEKFYEKLAKINPIVVVKELKHTLFVNATNEKDISPIQKNIDILVHWDNRLEPYYSKLKETLKDDNKIYNELLAQNNIFALIDRNEKVEKVYEEKMKKSPGTNSSWIYKYLETRRNIFDLIKEEPRLEEFYEDLKIKHGDYPFLIKGKLEEQEEIFDLISNDDGLNDLYDELLSKNKTNSAIIDNLKDQITINALIEDEGLKKIYEKYKVKNPYYEIFYLLTLIQYQKKVNELLKEKPELEERCKEIEDYNPIYIYKKLTGVI